MFTPIGSYEFVIDAYLTDFKGKATLPMIGGYMLVCATKHAEEREFGYSYMTSHNRVWVLSRMVIEVHTYPKNDSKLIIKTWVASVNRLFTERYFTFENENGDEIGYAKTLWACIDMDNRKPTNVLELKSMVDYLHEDKECPIEGFSKIASLTDGYDTKNSFEVQYSDIDINKHLNSMKYIEHLVDVFDIDLFKTKDIRRFEINYLVEGKYGTKLDILKKEEGNSVYLLDMKDNGTSICTSRITWK